MVASLLSQWARPVRVVLIGRRRPTPVRGQCRSSNEDERRCCRSWQTENRSTDREPFTGCVGESALDRQSGPPGPIRDQPDEAPPIGPLAPPQGGGGRSKRDPST